jgi:hypothetical protein
MRGPEKAPDALQVRFTTMASELPAWPCRLRTVRLIIRTVWMCHGHEGVPHHNLHRMEG